MDTTINDLLPHLAAGDILIDGGNSYYIDDIRRAQELAGKGVHYVDVGTSGGVWGRERGYCLMIGGGAAAVKHLDPIFAQLAPGAGKICPTPGRDTAGGTADQGYLHCGPNGAGHFGKMVHNGIEYGIMAAYAEGLGILRSANIGKRGQAVDAETTPLRDPEHYRRLAGTVGTDDGDDLTILHAEVDPAQDLMIAVAGAQRVDLEECAHAGMPRYASSTRGSRRTSANGPSTSRRPSARTITGSHSSAIRSMSCAMRRKVIPRACSSRMARTSEP